MRRTILAVLLISLVFLVNLALGAAQESFIKDKTGDGAVLTLRDGSVWEVSPAHRSESKEWQPGDRITVMESKDCLFNLAHGESVDARQIQPPQQDYRR
jgi:hypothetical protein